MQHLEVSGAVRPLKWSLGVKWLIMFNKCKAVLGQALSVPRGWAPRIYTQSAQEIDKVVSPTYRPPLPPLPAAPGHNLNTQFC